MGYAIAFQGTYQFEGAGAAERAIGAAREELAFEDGEADADLAKLVRGFFDRVVVREGASVRVTIDEYGPPGLYPIFELIVETLADAAAAGMVVSRMEGVEVEYPGGRDDG